MIFVFDGNMDRKWDPDTMCDIKLANRHIYTTCRKGKGLRNGRHSCMSAFVVSDEINVENKIGTCKLKEYLF